MDYTYNPHKSTSLTFVDIKQGEVFVFDSDHSTLYLKTSGHYYVCLRTGVKTYVGEQDFKLNEQDFKLNLAVRRVNVKMEYTVVLS